MAQYYTNKYGNLVNNINGLLKNGRKQCYSCGNIFNPSKIYCTKCAKC